MSAYIIKTFTKEEKELVFKTMDYVNNLKLSDYEKGRFIRTWDNERFKRDSLGLAFTFEGHVYYTKIGYILNGLALLLELEDTVHLTANDSMVLRVILDNKEVILNGFVRR